MRRDQLFERGQTRSSASPSLHEREAQTVQRIETLRVELHGSAKGRDGAVHVAALAQRDAEIGVGDSQGRIELGGRSESLDCRVELTLPAQNDPEVVLGFGILRLKGDSGPQRLERAGRILHQPPCDAKVILRIEQCGIQDGGAFEAR